MLSTVRIYPVTDTLKQFWELESTGIVDKGNAHRSLEEEESVRQFNEGLKFEVNVMKYRCYGKVMLRRSNQTTSRQSRDLRV